MMPSSLSRAVPNAGSPTSEASAKKSSVVLTLDVDPSAPPLDASPIGTYERPRRGDYGQSLRPGVRAPLVFEHRVHDRVPPPAMVEQVLAETTFTSHAETLEDAG